MKSFLRNWIVMTAILVFSFIAWANTVTAVSADSGGNQLAQKSAHWYEKSAVTVGPAAGLSANGGTRLALQAGSAVYINGKSTLHDYQMNANSLKGSAVLKGSSKDMLRGFQKGQVKALTFVVPVETLKSRESGLDDNADKALNAKVYPEIQFKLISETLKAGEEAGSYVMTAPGTLTAAGVSIPVTLNGTVTFSAKQARFKGVQKLKFSDFKIKPPSSSVLFVTITCSDEFEVYYDVIFAPAGL